MYKICIAKFINLGGGNFITYFNRRLGNLANWFVFNLYTVSIEEGRRHYFIGNLGDEYPFYWLFEREGTILFIYCSKHCWLEFPFMVYAVIGGLII